MIYMGKFLEVIAVLAATVVSTSFIVSAAANDVGVEYTKRKTNNKIREDEVSPWGLQKHVRRRMEEGEDDEEDIKGGNGDDYKYEDDTNDSKNPKSSDDHGTENEAAEKINHIVHPENLASSTITSNDSRDDVNVGDNNNKSRDSDHAFENKDETNKTLPAEVSDDTNKKNKKKKSSSTVIEDETPKVDNEDNESKDDQHEVGEKDDDQDKSEETDGEVEDMFDGDEDNSPNESVDNTAIEDEQKNNIDANEESATNNNGEDKDDKKENEEEEKDQANDDSQNDTSSTSPGEQEQEQQNDPHSWNDDDDDGFQGGAIIIFLVIFGSVVGILYRRNKDKISDLFNNGGSNPFGESLAAVVDGGGTKTAKYEQVASGEGEADEEWGWGDDDIDDDDVEDIEMTTSNVMNGSYNDSNMTQRRPSLDNVKTAKSSISPPQPCSTRRNASPTTPITKKMPLVQPASSNLNSATGRNGVGISDAVINHSITVTGSQQQQQYSSVGFSQQSQLPTNVGGIPTRITSLGPKKKPTAQAQNQRRKKTLLSSGNPEDDIFASMGLGGSTTTTAPSKITAKPPGSLWSAQTTTPSSKINNKTVKTTLINNKPPATKSTNRILAGSNFPVTAAVLPQKEDPIPINLYDTGIDTDDGIDVKDSDWGDDDDDLDDLLFD